VGAGFRGRWAWPRCRSRRKPKGSPCRSSSGSLNEHITRPAIAMRPEWALLAHAAVRIIDSLFMRAADNRPRHCDRLGPVTLDETQDFTRNLGICPKIPFRVEPAFQGVRFRALRGQNRHCYFGGKLVIRSVERDGG